MEGGNGLTVVNVLLKSLHMLVAWEASLKVIEARAFAHLRLMVIIFII